MSYYLSKIYRHNLSILIGKKKKYLVRDGKDLCVFVKFNIWAYSSRKIVYCIKSLVLVHDMLQIESIGPCQTPLKKTNAVNLYIQYIYMCIYVLRKILNPYFSLNCHLFFHMKWLQSTIWFIEWVQVLIFTNRICSSSQ